MLTDQDIKKLMEVFSTREEIDNRFEELRKDFSNLQSAVDSYAKRADTYFQEMLMLARRVDRIEKWVREIADKTGVKLDY